MDDSVPKHWTDRVDALLVAHAAAMRPEQERRRHRSDAELRAVRDEDERRWHARQRAMLAHRQGRTERPGPPDTEGRARTVAPGVAPQAAAEE